MKPTVVELFAGAGGASLGLLAAGFEEVRAVEWNADACETRRAAGLRCDEGDVRDPAHYAGVTADAVWSSFPCQAWSTAGKRLGKDDPRNGWPWTVDVLDQVRPAWFMGENVPGLTFHRGECNGRCADDCARLYFEETILRDLRQRFAWVGWSILDAARFGVPQNRERLFIVAGPRPIVWPVETHAPPEELRQGGLFGERRKPWVTVREALNLGGRVLGGGRRGHGMAEWEPADVTDRPAATINAMQSSTAGHYVVEDPKHPHVRPDAPAPALRPGGAGHSAPPMWLNQMIGSSQTSGRKTGRVPCESTVDAPSPTVRANEGVGLTIRIESWSEWRDKHLTWGFGWADYAEASGHPEDAYHPDGVTRRLVSPVPMPAWASGGSVKPTRAASRPELLDRPSPTVTTCEVKGTRGENQHGGPDRASDAAWLGAGIRRLTPAECAKLMAFPDDYPWRGTKTSIYAQIGNGCCPPVVEALARAVRSA